MWNIARGCCGAYISRMENGHTAPTVETVEKFARALEAHVPAFLRRQRGPEPSPKLRPKRTGWGDTGKEARELGRFRTLLAKMEERRRLLLLFPAQR